MTEALVAIRPITLTFINKTGGDLSFAIGEILSGTRPKLRETGKDTDPPSGLLSDGGTLDVYASDELLFGPKGIFFWYFRPEGQFAFLYDHPLGNESTTVRVLAIPGDYKVDITKDDLNHHTAKATYTLARR